MNSAAEQQTVLPPPRIFEKLKKLRSDAPAAILALSQTVAAARRQREIASAPSPGLSRHEKWDAFLQGLFSLGFNKAAAPKSKSPPARHDDVDQLTRDMIQVSRDMWQAVGIYMTDQKITAAMLDLTPPEQDLLKRMTRLDKAPAPKP